MQVKRMVDDELVVRQADPVEAAETVRANLLLEETTIRRGVRFETGLLWSRDSLILPSSRKMAMMRFLSLEAKFQRDDNFFKQYARVMLDYERKGYSRKLSETDQLERGPRTWYLAHFGVYNPSKPGKLRLVFDAAAKVDGVSVNSVLLSGSEQSPPLLNILLKFRQRVVGVCADIVEMFHQVLIRKEDRAAQRFLWRDDRENPVEEYEMMVMTFGATCSPCSAQYIKNVNSQEFRERYPEAAEAIINNHYVDDFVHCFENEDEAARITKEVIWIHEQGGFDLKKIISNSALINSTFNSEVAAATTFNLERGEDAEFQKVLGMQWDIQQDALKFVLSFRKVDPAIVNDKRRPTKREVLRVTMSVFDPFGMAAEYMLVAKLLLQSIWRKGTDWDQAIPEEDHDVWMARYA